MKLLNILKEYLGENQHNNLNDNFWKWFGNSTTIQDNKPIVFYHGTDTIFNEFTKKHMGKNFWQSKSKVYGGGFFFVDKERYAFPLGTIKKVYLKIENPYLIVLENRYGYDPDYYDTVDMFDRNPYNYFQLAYENGNDGIIIKSPKGGLYIVFEPNQIKSIDNNGTWSTTDNNIYK